MSVLHIKVFQDTVCPWCKIGKKNLLTALQELHKMPDEIAISYITFFLHRDIPAEGVNYKEYLTSKFQGIDLHQINAGPTRIGKLSGVNFNFDKITIIPNTIMSNVLIYLTPPEKKEKMIDSIFEAYFEQGQNIGSLDVLMELATEVGVSVTPEQLQSNKNRDLVIQDDEYGKRLGITGVPFFVFDDTYALSGAQPVSAFKNVIQRIDGELETLL